MSIIITQLITSMLGSLGFAMIFNLHKKYMIAASLGGMICWVSYLITYFLENDVFISALVASATATLYAEFMARFLKVPTTVIFVSSIVPLIPGSSLYYTMSHAVSGETELFSEFGIRTIHYILGITCGISIIWSIWYMVQKIMILRLNKNHGEDI